MLSAMSGERYGTFETARSGAARPKKGRPARQRGAAWEVLEFLVILAVAFALVWLVVRPYIAEAFWIPSESMVPTLEVDDRVLVNKLAYRFGDPERGDVAVFESVEPPVSPEDKPSDLIKRIVALPGDTVEVQSGTLLVNGAPQDESRLNPELPDTSSYGPTTVPEGHVFFIGDNRANSQDSRVFGPVPMENVEGEAVVRFWPVSRVGGL